MSAILVTAQYIDYDNVRCDIILIQSWYTISGKGCFYIRKIKGSHISDEQDYNIVSQQYGLSLPQSSCVFIEIQVVEPGMCL